MDFPWVTAVCVLLAWFFGMLSSAGMVVYTLMILSDSMDFLTKVLVVGFWPIGAVFCASCWYFIGSVWVRGPYLDD